MVTSDFTQYGFSAQIPVSYKNHVMRMEHELQRLEGNKKPIKHTHLLLYMIQAAWEKLFPTMPFEEHLSLFKEINQTIPLDEQDPIVKKILAIPGMKKYLESL